MEQWRDVVGYEGAYRVSSFGKVRGKRGVLKPWLTNCGYEQVQLYKEKTPKGRTVHSLVAEAFIGKSNGLVVNHIDENKRSNSSGNLEYVTQAENVRHGTGIDRRSKARSLMVGRYDKISGELLEEYHSLSSTRKQGYSHGNISMCCNGKRKSHKGFLWRYLDKE